MSIFGNFTKGLTNFLDFGSNNDDLSSLPKEELLKKVSLINSENSSLQKSINEISKENSLLQNSIINDKNKNNSEFSKFLNLMQINLLHNNNSSNINYTNNDFKKFLYKEKLFYGCLDENDTDILLKAKKENKLEWDDKKIREKNKLKQEILEKNLKTLYSNLFTNKTNKKRIPKDKDITPNKKENDDNKKDKSDNISNINNSKNEKKEEKKSVDENKYQNYKNNKSNEKEKSGSNILENLIFNQDEDDE